MESGGDGRGSGHNLRHGLRGPVKRKLPPSLITTSRGTYGKAGCHVLLLGTARYCYIANLTSRRLKNSLLERSRPCDLFKTRRTLDVWLNAVFGDGRQVFQYCLEAMDRLIIFWSNG